METKSQILHSLLIARLSGKHFQNGHKLTSQMQGGVAYNLHQLRELYGKGLTQDLLNALVVTKVLKVSKVGGYRTYALVSDQYIDVPDTDLSRSALKVMLSIYMSGGQPLFEHDIALSTGMSRRSVVVAIKHLVDQGYISISRKSAEIGNRKVNCMNHYTINFWRKQQQQ